MVASGTLLMPELLGLTELKRAKAAGYTKISRLADGGSAVPLDSWHGFTAETGSGSVHVGVSYILNGNNSKRCPVDGMRHRQHSATGLRLPLSQYPLQATPIRIPGR